jgi:programmed cell death 6-interacting protein
MLALPFKESGPLKLTAPLTAYITAHYSAEEADRFKPVIEELVALRNEVCEVVSANERGRAAMRKYYAQIDNMSGVFPVSTSQLQLAFAWKSAFVKKASHTQCDWNYEKAAVLFNMAALESQAGVDQDRSDVDGIKTAAKYFIQAASLLNALREGPGAGLLGAQPPEFKADGLSALMYIMQAQAQACFFEAAKARNMSSAGLAKISMQCSLLFRDAFNAASGQPELASALRDAGWLEHLRYQTNCFLGVAHYRESELEFKAADEIAEGYGIEIARLDVAERAVIKALETGSSRKEAAEALLAVIRARKIKAVDNNNSIYRERIPEPSTLKKIEPALLAKLATPFALPAAGDDGIGPGLFDSLVPAEVTAAATALLGEQTATVSEAAAKAGAATEAIKARLGELNLPAALSAKESVTGIPDSVWDRVHAVQLQGGLGGLRAMAAANAAAHDEVASQLEESTRGIAEEAEEDGRMRERYGHMWTASPSGPVNEGNQAQLAHYRGLLSQGAAADEKVRSRLDEEAPALEQLGSDRASLEALVPSVTGEAAATAEEQRLQAAVRSSLDAIDQLIAAREKLVGELMESLDARPLGRRLLEAGGIDAKDTVWAAFKAEVLTPKLEALESNVVQQAGLQERVEREFELLSGSSAQSAAMKARQDAIATLGTAVDTFHTLHSNLREGEGFYASLERHARLLGEAVKGMVYARHMQASELQMEIEARQKRQEEDARMAASLSESGSSAAGAGGATSAPAPAPAPSAYPAALPVAPAAPGSYGGVPPGVMPPSSVPYATPVMPAGYVHPYYMGQPGMTGYPAAYGGAWQQPPPSAGPPQ